MAEAFKNLFNEQFLHRFAERLKVVVADFDACDFATQVMDSEWERRELKQRVAHIAHTLKKFLPAAYQEAMAKILELLDYEEQAHPDFSKIDDKKFGLTLEYGLILDSYVEQFGMDDYATSVKAIERITQFSSCEFVAHAFILKYPQEMMAQMLRWSKHKHWGVRRLASEGCRPRLPWAKALPMLKENPSPIIPILENLKNDPARFVRLSVANNLNDISKDNPDIVIDLVKKWQGKSENVDWVLKHGSRTLLKQGNSEILELFGLNSASNILIEHFQLSTAVVQVGNSLEFSFNLLNKSDKKQKVRLEYAIYYQKASAALTKKVCKISEKDYAGHSLTPICRKHSFKVVTTRKFHPGLHQVSIIINGMEFEKFDFELVL